MFEGCRGILWYYVCTFIFPELPRACPCAVLETVVVDGIVALSWTLSGLWQQLVAAVAFYQSQSPWGPKATRRACLRAANIWVQSERAGKVWATNAVVAFEAPESGGVGYGGLAGTLDR